MKPVLCFGDVCPDLIIPYGNAQLAASGVSIDPAALVVEALSGGSVGNTTVGIARQNVPVMFLGTVGNDPLGRMLHDDLVKEGVDVSLLKLSQSCSTVMILIVVDKNGDRTTFAWPKVGASQHQVTASQIPHDITDRISWLHSTGMTLREEPAASTQIELMRRCHEQGIPVSLDINARIESLGDPQFERNVHDALPYCSVILGSADDEIMPLTNCKSADEAARALAVNGRIVVSRMGEKGAKVYYDGKVSSAPAARVQVADTVGAGDIYDAGYICATLKGYDPSSANVRACATATFSITGRSGRSSPTADELEEFIRTNIR
ncbi:MAG: sugar kinase [Eubacteriales bacterium]|nr:sugar kinase [Eubacteriales bacterium]